MQMYRYQISTQKDAKDHLPVGKCNLKPWSDTTTQFLEWLKLKINYIKCWWRCTGTGMHTAGVNVTGYNHFGKTVCQFL